MNTDAYILRTENVHKNYVGVHALCDINFAVKRGDIHCLVGENGSGKSTLVKLISGAEQPSGGRIVLNGNPYSRLSTSESMAEGVQTIYQDFSLFEHMSVADNIAINKLLQQRNKTASRREINRIAVEAMDRVGIALPLEVPVRELSVANKQLVSICRSLALDAKLLFMDEPTTALTLSEIERLLEIILGLKEKGYTVVFISHKLDEVMKVSDSITVLRDGRLVGDFTPDEVNDESLAYHMTGRRIGQSQYRREAGDDQPLLELDKLTKARQYEEISLSIRKGDIVGLIGLIGSGRTELALSLFGLNKQDTGSIRFEGRKVNLRKTRDAKKIGIGLVPEDRAEQGVFLDVPLRMNVVSAIIKRLKGPLGVLDTRQIQGLVEDSVKTCNVKASNIDVHARTLSGGNQQKLVVAKWLATAPKLLILDSPTVGVDIGSKAEIYGIIQEYARKDCGVIMISDEVNEILANCNKVIVMFQGRVLELLEEADLDRQGIDRVIQMLVETGDSSLLAELRGKEVQDG